MANQDKFYEHEGKSIWLAFSECVKCKDFRSCYGLNGERGADNFPHYIGPDCYEEE